MIEDHRVHIIAEGVYLRFHRVSFGRDITRRKLAEERMRDSERRLRLLAEAIPHQVWSYLPDDTMNYCNQRWMDYTGLTLEEGQREGWAKHLHPADVELAQKTWQEASSQRKPYEVEVRLRRVDGRYRRFVSRAVPLYDERGQLVQWFGTNTDVEERRKSQEALHKAQSVHCRRPPGPAAACGPGCATPTL